MAQCCSEPQVRGGKCVNCDTWLEDVAKPSLLDELRAYEDSLTGKDRKVFKTAYEEARTQKLIPGREALALGKEAVRKAQESRK